MKVNKYLLPLLFLLVSFQVSAGSGEKDGRIFHIEQAELAGLQLALNKLESLGLVNDFSVMVERESNLVHYTFYEGEFNVDARGNTSDAVIFEFHYSIADDSVTYNYVR